MLGLCINSKETMDFFMGVIKNSVNHREIKNIQRNDFLQLLINTKNSGAGMTMNEMAANSCEFMTKLKCRECPKIELVC